MQGLIGSCKNTTKIYNFPLIFSLCYDIIFNCQSNFGWVPEWPKGADCKSVASRFGGSNPPPSIIIFTIMVVFFQKLYIIIE